MQGNIARVRNYILDQELKRYGNVTVIDDDFSGLSYWDHGETVSLKEKDLQGFLAKYYDLCDQFGFKVWGVNVNPDRMVYRDYTPFSTVSVILAPFTAHLNHNIRYDESIPLKEDYDFAIQQINKYRGVLRVNKYHYICKQSAQKGGCAVMRSRDEEERQLRLLQKKWGSDIVGIDKGNSGRTKKVKPLDYNPIIKIPIKGV